MRGRLAPVAVVVLTLVVIVGQWACGGGGVTTPSKPAVRVEAARPASVVVLAEAVQDVAGDPITGAQFAVNGQIVGSTGSDGRIVLDLKPGDAIQVTSTCLQLDALWRDGASPTFRLNCMEAGFIREILFRGQDAPSDASLTQLARPRPDVPGGVATLNVSVEAAHDYFSADVLPEALARSNTFTEGITNFAVGVGKVIVHYRLDAADPFFASAAGAGAGAYTQSRYESGWIVESKVVVKNFLTTDGRTLCTRDQAIQLLVHENGHVLGLGHHEQPGAMNPRTAYWFPGPKGPETRAAVFATYRPSGTRWMDNQAAAMAAGANGRNGWGEREACPPPSRSR